MNTFYEEHPDGKKLPQPPQGLKPYAGWTDVSADVAVEEKLVPLRDTMGDAVCPLLLMFRVGGDRSKEKAQCRCIKHECAFYSVVHEPRYEVDPQTGRPVTKADKDGKLQPVLLEDAANGYCGLMLQTETLYHVAGTVRRIEHSFGTLMANMTLAGTANRPPQPQGKKLLKAKKH